MVKAEALFSCRRKEGFFGGERREGGVSVLLKSSSRLGPGKKGEIAIWGGKGKGERGGGRKDYERQKRTPLSGRIAENFAQRGSETI